jgi:hypothetical protein
MSDVFVTGDTRTKLVQLSINELPFEIAPTSSVTAQIVSKDKSKILSSEIATCESDMAGADWATSLVAVKFPREATAAIKVTGEEISANLEIQVTIDPLVEPEDITFYVPIKVIKGNLP